MGGQLLGGNVEDGGGQTEKVGAYLPGLSHRDGEGRGYSGVFISGPGLKFPGIYLRQSLPLLGQALQHLPPQGIEGGEGDA